MAGRLATGSGTYKGADGLTEQEREAYEACRKFSCVHEACIHRWHNTVEQPRRSEVKCGALYEQWRACFEDTMARTARDPQRGTGAASPR